MVIVSVILSYYCYYVNNESRNKEMIKCHITDVYTTYEKITI